MKSLTDVRREMAADALRKLKYEVIPALESVIAGTPTGDTRDKLTEANIILQMLVK